MVKAGSRHAGPAPSVPIRLPSAIMQPMAGMLLSCIPVNEGFKRLKACHAICPLQMHQRAQAEAEPCYWNLIHETCKAVDNLCIQVCLCKLRIIDSSSALMVAVSISTRERTSWKSKEQPGMWMPVAPGVVQSQRLLCRGSKCQTWLSTSSSRRLAGGSVKAARIRPERGCPRGFCRWALLMGSCCRCRVRDLQTPWSLPAGPAAGLPLSYRAVVFVLIQRSRGEAGIRK